MVREVTLINIRSCLEESSLRYLNIKQRQQLSSAFSKEGIQKLQSTNILVSYYINIDLGMDRETKIQIENVMVM